MNSVNLVGRLGQDPTIKYFESGSVVGEFSLAVDGWNGEQKVTHWIPCKAWGKTAQIIADFVRKGSQVAVSGEIRQESWQDRNSGDTRSKLVVNVSRIDLLGKKAEQADDDNGF